MSDDDFDRSAFGPTAPLVDSESIASQANAIRAAMVSMQDLWAIAIEATTGYRQALLDAGFSLTAAEQMAVDFHRLTISNFF